MKAANAPPITVLATAFWKRLDLTGHDAAWLIQTETGYRLTGQCTFLDPRGPAALGYQVDLAPDWSTIEGRIKGFIGERAIDDRVLREQRGWTLNSKDFGMAELNDLDLGFTPATKLGREPINGIPKALLI